jgi:hypothetical protein
MFLSGTASTSTGSSIALAQYGCDQVYTHFHVSVWIFRYYIFCVSLWRIVSTVYMVPCGWISYWVVSYTSSLGKQASYSIDARAFLRELQNRWKFEYSFGVGYLFDALIAR